MPNCLYFTYDGLLDPLGESQILPYIESLNKNNYDFIILSYEKENKKKEDILKLQIKLKSKGINWKPLIFRKGKINFLFRIIIGVYFINFFHIQKRIDLVHLRGGYSGLIYFLSLCRNKYIYDIRAFWGQWADGGRTKYNSITYKILLNLEKRLINKASGVVVLDNSGKAFLDKNYQIKKPLFVIPTSTDIGKFQLNKNFESKQQINFVYLGGVNYPPYRIKDALLFINYLNNQGIVCKIDFINRNEHKTIERIIKKEKLNKINYSIISLKHEQIFKVLPKYDVGLIFLENGKWIKMSSPTKIGEYLAAGLKIIGNKNIAVLDRLANESLCVETIKINKIECSYSSTKIKNLLRKIKDKRLKIESQKLAKKYYSLKNANKQYLNLYKKVFNQIK